MLIKITDEIEFIFEKELPSNKSPIIIMFYYGVLRFYRDKIHLPRKKEHNEFISFL